MLRRGEESAAAGFYRTGIACRQVLVLPVRDATHGACPGLCAKDAKREVVDLGHTACIPEDADGFLQFGGILIVVHP